MRTAILIGALMISLAIDPKFTSGVNASSNFFTILLISFAWDILESMSGKK